MPIHLILLITSDEALNVLFLLIDLVFLVIIEIRDGTRILEKERSIIRD